MGIRARRHDFEHPTKIRGRRLRARLHHGPLSHQVIALAATGQLDMAAAGQIRLAVVKSAYLCRLAY
jgi:hypothetical protein